METTNVSKEEGLRLLKAGEIDNAIETLREALKTNRDDAQVFTYLGAAYAKKNDKLHAIASFEESVRLFECAPSYYNLGQIYETVNRMDEAIRQYKMAVTLDSEYAPAKNALDRLKKKFMEEHPEIFQKQQESEQEEQEEIVESEPVEKKGMFSKLKLFSKQK